MWNAFAFALIGRRVGVTTDHSGGKGSLAETAWMFKLRRNLDQLDSIHGQTAQDVLQARSGPLSDC